MIDIRTKLRYLYVLTTTDYFKGKGETCLDQSNKIHRIWLKNRGPD